MNVTVAFLAIAIVLTSTPVSSAGIIFNIDWGGRVAKARAVRLQSRYGHGVAISRSNSMYETTTFESLPVETRAIESLPVIAREIFEARPVAVVEELPKATQQQPAKKEDDPVLSKATAEKQSEKSAGKPDEPKCVGDSCKQPAATVSAASQASRPAIVSRSVSVAYATPVYSSTVYSTVQGDTQLYSCDRCVRTVSARAVARSVEPVGDGSGRIFSGRIRNAIRHSRFTPFR